MTPDDKHDTDRPAASAPSRAAHEAELFDLQHQCEASLRAVVAQLEQLYGVSSRQRTAIDAAAERQRAMGGRLAVLRLTLSRVGDAATRLGLIAINAGLEAARVEGPAGRALLVLSEELRTLLGRANDASRDVEAGLEELTRDLSGLEQQLGDARSASAQLSDAAASLLKSAHEADANSRRLGERMAAHASVKPETLVALRNAEQHARALAQALEDLRDQGLAPSSLPPALRHLSRLLDDGPLSR